MESKSTLRKRLSGDEDEKHASSSKKRKVSAQEEDEKVQRQALLKLDQGRRGTVISRKMKNNKKVPHVPGYLSVFPNFRHQFREDGFGCSSLSPMSLGPVRHSEPGMPDAKNLENYHQFAKAFPCDVDPETKIPVYGFWVGAKSGYLDSNPHRHKYNLQLLLANGPKGNLPLYSARLDVWHRLRKFNYVESRYFYCHYYEKLAKETEDFRVLLGKVEQGVNLNLIGYDGRPMEWEKKGSASDQKEWTQDELGESLWREYLRTDTPFGHEMALCTLLMLQDPKLYPWNRYYREHPEIYHGMEVGN